MPYIEIKTTVPVTAAQAEELKSALGRAVATLHKTETYLMVGLEDNFSLWMGGKKLEKGAYVSVSLYGSAAPSDYDRMTGQICAILEKTLGLPGQGVYVTYHPVSDWGWNGSNF